MSKIKTPNKTEVLEQIDRILKSPDFVGSARLSKFLSFIVSKSLENKDTLLKGYTIGLEVFDKPENFDPDTDSSVRVEASRLRKALTLYYFKEGKHDPVVISMPKGSYKPEFSYNEIQAETATYSPKSILNKRNALGVAIFFVILCVIHFTNNHTHEDAFSNRTNPQMLPTIAILPFNVIGDNEADDIGEEISVDLISKLSAFSNINLMSDISIGENRIWRSNIIQAGQDINADYLIEGNIKKYLDQLRIIIRVLDVRKTTYIWSYDEELRLEAGNALSVAINKIVAQLASPLGVIHNAELEKIMASRDKNLWAYRCIFDFYTYTNNKTEDEHKRVKQCLEKVTQAMPKYSDAWAFLSWIYGDEIRYGFNLSGKPEEAKMKSLNAAKRALETNQKNARAHEYMAIAAHLDGDNNLALHHTDLSVALNPNDTEVIVDAAWKYGQFGEWDKSEELAKRATDINMGHARWYHGILFANYYNKGDYPHALVHALEYFQPDALLSQVALAAAYAGMNKTEEAKSVADDIERKFPKFLKDPEGELAGWRFQPSFIEKLIIGTQAAGVAFDRHDTENE